MVAGACARDVVGWWYRVVVDTPCTEGWHWMGRWQPTGRGCGGVPGACLRRRVDSRMGGRFA